VDLIDEAASALRISLENKPPQLEETDRKIRRLEIELAALKKDKTDIAKARKEQQEKERLQPYNFNHCFLKEGQQNFLFCQQHW
jgi:ATP-dependent Clp protease ATP-binding subunit ClpA